VPFAQQPVIQLRDASGNPVSQSEVSVTAAIATGGGTLGGTLSATTNGSGVATFTDLEITGTAGDRTLGFSATGLASVESNTITITAGAATQLTLTTQPSATARSGVAFAQQPVVQLRDGAGNAVSEAMVTVTATIASGPGGATLSNATATTGSTGAATFSGLAISGPVGDYTLSFGATGLSSIGSGTITLTAGPAASIGNNSPTTQSAPAGTPVASPPSVIVRDASGNPVAGVEVTFATGPNSGTVDPTLPIATGGDGTATVNSWTLSTLVGVNTLTATAGPDGINGNPVLFTATGTAGTPSSSQSSVSAPSTPIMASNGESASTITVTVRDQVGNAVSGATVTLASLDPGTKFTQPSGTTNGEGQIAGTLSAKVVGTKTVTATVNATVTLNQTATVTVVPGPAATLSFTGQPSDAGTGVPITPPVVVTAQDEFGNTADAFTGAITLSITQGTGTVLAALSGTNPVNPIGGLATFPDLSINLPSTLFPYKLDAGANGLTGATSSSFNVTGLSLP